MEVAAKKKFGQNFLKDKSVVNKIIQSMPNTDNVIVEIGPGLGDLTQELLKKKDVIAFEIDPDLCTLLQEKFSESLEKRALKLHCGDVLDRWKQHLVDKEYDLVANLPYYVATNIVLRALRDPNCKNILVMLQKEVADKFCAKPGQREFSALSVLAGSAGEVQRVTVVKPNSFTPPPKVDSAVILIKKNRSIDDDNFETFLKIAFRQPRKTLLKNLAQSYPKELLQQLFQTLGVASNIRPHEASTSIYHRLYEMLKEKIDGATTQKQPTKRESAKKSTT
ncbi:16S rRNA (adenine(1518)-N(6)/adenine(1519)-N(6))-dimethyltransferase RsmA [Nitratiruptor sp. SB155-2]|uniref:16S rRNA (adenine(1518)-N(6)/adenine(1519)-N(6))- dimethyltransferase RsmA n=1 Tax=Nitratiruptor sp. (strain SB155-2) TaxID=387092 RepID=UPI0001586E7C|nr:16S rRNA (adenine(1518)-N(6)/adenine(1519)-N(6))-dimethyltransferase RsmA [Nitratiruptor sp. SB155-2]BAF69178.1 dimethyladenosine transferase [Nitratiruptor sp. SB155-2]